MSKLIGFYPGSFDPVTNGHMDVIERACALVDTLVIGVGINAQKKPLIEDSLRIKLLIDNCEPITQRTGTKIDVIDFDGLMVHAASELNAKLIIRGLRDTTDYNYEMQMVGMNGQMAPDLQTVFVPSGAEVRHISATLVRQISQMGGDITAFVPSNVLEVLRK